MSETPCDLPEACCCPPETPENFRYRKASVAYFLLLEIDRHREMLSKAAGEGLDQTTTVLLEVIDHFHKDIGAIEEEIAQSYADEPTPVTEEPQPPLSPP